tara:strand:+ start:14346 stop:15995 length:1650 start_codon:yes stop_codon:yes gene_type:complete
MSLAPVTDFLLEKASQEYNAITILLIDLMSLINIKLELIHSFIFFASFTALSGIVAVMVQYAVLKIKYDVLVDLISDALGQFLTTRFSFFSKGDMGTLMNSFQLEMNRVGDSFGEMANLLANILQGMVLILIPFLLAPKLTLIFICITIIFSLPIWYLNKMVYDLGQKNTDTSNRMTGILQESLSAAKIVLSFGRQKDTVTRYRSSFEDHASVSVKYQTLVRSLSLLFFPVGLSAALVAIYVDIQNGTSLSQVVMVLFAFTRLLPVMSIIIQSRANVGGLAPSYEQIQRLKKEALKDQEPTGGTLFKEFQESIEFKNVNFSYTADNYVLKDTNLIIKKGSMHALVGKSGAGKSTIVDIILGLYSQDSGSILIDGKELTSINLNSYREKIGYVPQDTFLFNASIYENLLWSNPKASKDKILEACKLANALDFIDSSSDGLHTVVGDRGVRLSGGQKQRIGLARALVRDPEILILDEATSSLDTESEKLIQKAIDNLIGNLTIIVIAHRLSTIRNATNISYMHFGSVVEEGSYDELSNNQESLLFELIKNQ